MIGILKQIFLMKSGPVNRLLGFAAFFTILLGGVFGALYLAATLKVLSGAASVVIQIAAYLAGGVVLYYAIIRLRTDDSQDASKNSLIPFLLNFLVGLFFAFLMRGSAQVLMQFGLDLIFYLNIILMLVGIFGIGVSALSAWLIANNSAGRHQMHLYLFKSLSLYFGKIKFLIISFFVILVTALAVVIVDDILWPNFQALNFTPLLLIFYKTTATACIMAAAILFLMKAAYVIHADNIIYEPEGRSLVGFVLSGLILVGIIYVSFPKMTNLVEEEYSRIISQAEQYREEGKLYLCGNAYKKAYALTKAYNGYLMEIQVAKDKDATDEQKNRIRNEANTLFREAYEFYPNAGLIYYLDGLRILEENQGAAINAFSSAKQYEPDLYQADLLVLELANAMNHEELMHQTADSLIQSEVYSKEPILNALSSRKIEAALESVAVYQQVAMENITTIAYDYYDNQLYNEAMGELQAIKEILPKDIVTNYLIAMTDLALKADNKTYTTAIEAAETILNEYPDEAWAQDLYTGVTLRAGNQAVMDEALKEAYDRNPDDLDVAEQYAYALLRKNYSSSYYDVTEEAETVVDRILEKDGERWFANYCKALIELYKAAYDSSINYFNRFNSLIIEDRDLFSIQDELYNIYVLKYARRMAMDQQAAEVLNGSDSVTGFAYNYIMGAFGTMSNQIDNMGTIDYLKRAVAFNPNFSKPYYMIGNAYIEYGYRNSELQSYLEAEQYYDRSIQIFEEDPYAWFAMGHCYKKQERYEEAKGAFQKTLSYMPAQDHQSDHFGVSIHSTLQITEIERILAEQEGQ